MSQREPLPTVAVVIPAFRADAHSEAVLPGIPDSASNIVVVDDDSPDNVAAVVATFPDARTLDIQLQGRPISSADFRQRYETESI